MDRRFFMASLAACPLCAAAARAEEKASHWSYDGASDAEHWGSLDSKFSACATGAQQSPVDLEDTVKASLKPLTANWRAEAYEVVNNGHTLQLDVKQTDQLTLDGRKYRMVQFHFHTPSEHAVHGKRTAMEAHFVHKAEDDSGRLCVVGVLIEPGARNAAFAEIMAVAPEKEGKAALKGPINPAAFLPARHEVFRYEGSLTTPPCSEVVDWAVFVEPVTAAQSDIDAFRKRFAMNARPLQALRRRFILRGG